MPEPREYRLGDYRLLECIGEGGMAEVFRAEFVGQPGGSIPRGTVVVKRIRPELFSQREFPIFREMFLNEAKLVQRLSHDNLARIFALCEARDPASGVTVPFIVGEFIRGRDLWSLMQRATDGFSGAGLPPGIAAYIVREVARGLGHAHAHRDNGRPQPIIHRDVSPENIMISDAGEIKVIDFGVAKAIGGFGPQTRTGIIKGKLSYMAPEQVAQRALPATDVFGAGIVLHELLTGRRLFGGKNEFLVVQRVLNAVIPTPGSRAAVPRDLDAVVMRALDRRLERRFRDGNVLAEALTDVLDRLPELGHVDGKMLMQWIALVERNHPERIPRERTGESDLHVDVDKAIRAVEGARGDTINLSMDDLADMMLGPVEGPIDPGVHGAVTQAMKMLTPEMLLRSQQTVPSADGQAQSGQPAQRQSPAMGQQPTQRQSPAMGQQPAQRQSPAMGQQPAQRQSLPPVQQQQSLPPMQQPLSLPPVQLGPNSLPGLNLSGMVPQRDPTPLGPRGTGTIRAPVVAFLPSRPDSSREITAQSQPSGPGWAGVAVVAVGTLLVMLLFFLLG